MSAVATIGLISDTHGLMRPEALAAMQGCDLIIHAGDVGRPEIIEQLRYIAPVIAVTGNVDKDAWTALLPMTAIAEGGSSRIYVLHDVAQLDINPAAAQFNIVVSGHSHKPSRTLRDNVMYLNPGSAGPRRFQLPVTVARLNVRSFPLTVEFVEVFGSSGKSA
jgi:putative phosphoesterase